MVGLSPWGWGTQQDRSHQWQLGLEACLRTHLLRHCVATRTDLPVRGLESRDFYRVRGDQRWSRSENQERLVNGSNPQECTTIQSPGAVQEEVRFPGNSWAPRVFLAASGPNMGGRKTGPWSPSPFIMILGAWFSFLGIYSYFLRSI